MIFSDLSTDQEWYPRQKVAYARRKFEGHNPAYITRYNTSNTRLYMTTPLISHGM